MATYWPLSVVVECERCGEQVHAGVIELGSYGGGIRVDWLTLELAGWSYADETCPRCNGQVGEADDGEW